MAQITLPSAESSFAEEVLLSLLKDTSTSSSGWFIEAANLDLSDWLGESGTLSTSLPLLGELPSEAIQETRGRWLSIAGYQPRTELGRILLAIRRRIEAAGIPLLSAEEVSNEVASRRGERS